MYVYIYRKKNTKKLHGYKLKALVIHSKSRARLTLFELTKENLGSCLCLTNTYNHIYTHTHTLANGVSYFFSYM